MAGPGLNPVPWGERIRVLGAARYTSRDPSAWHLSAVLHACFSVALQFSGVRPADAFCAAQEGRPCPLEGLGARPLCIQAAGASSGIHSSASARPWLGACPPEAPNLVGRKTCPGRCLQVLVVAQRHPLPACGRCWAETAHQRPLSWRAIPAHGVPAGHWGD